MKPGPGLFEMLSEEQEQWCNEYYEKNRLLNADGTPNKENIKRFVESMTEMLEAFKEVINERDQNTNG